MWKDVSKSESIEDLITVSVIQQMKGKKLIGVSIRFYLMGGGQITFPAKLWRKARESIDLFLAEHVGEFGEEL